MKKTILSLAVSMAVMTALSGCVFDSSSGTTNAAPPAAAPPPAAPSIPVPSSIQSSAPGYAISVFAQAPNSTTSQPDDIIQNGQTVIVGYQNHVSTTNSPAGFGTIVVYDLNGNALQTFSNIPGHVEGLLLINPTTLWVNADEDGNPQLSVINLTTGASNPITTYQPDAAANTLLTTGGTGGQAAGGLDDMKMVNGNVTVSASAPAFTLSPSPSHAPYSTDGNGATAQFGVNTGPALYTMALDSGALTFSLTTILSSGTIPATLLPANTTVTLNMTDEDSSAIDTAGDLVVDSQQDSELVFIHNLGVAGQTISALPVSLYGNPWPLDDIRWVPSAVTSTSFMLVTDHGANMIYKITATNGFTAGNVYGTGSGSVLQLNPATGALTPIYVGISGPKGMAFIIQ